MKWITKGSPVAIGALCVIVSTVLWLATDRETFTRWPNEKLESTEVAPSDGEDELLASIGFDDAQVGSEIPDIKSRFAMGLVPGGFDPKHLLSVATCSMLGLGVATIPFISQRVTRGRSPQLSQEHLA